jgi:hypothetical protein
LWQFAVGVSSTAINAGTVRKYPKKLITAANEKKATDGARARVFNSQDCKGFQPAYWLFSHGCYLSRLE